MATSQLPYHPFLSSSKSHSIHRTKLQTHHRFPFSTLPNNNSSNFIRIQAFRRSDFDGFARRMASGELWKDAWRNANNGFEQLLYETKKTAERLDRRYSVARRLSAVAQSAADRARELDRDFEITQRWRTFTLDFSRNWPRYRKQLNDFLDTPLGRSFAVVLRVGKRLESLIYHMKFANYATFCVSTYLIQLVKIKNYCVPLCFWVNFIWRLALFHFMVVGWPWARTIFFLWFALSGWLFRILIFATWVLPFAGPLLIGAVANNLVIKGSCPACKRQFVGYKNQMVRCTGCGNIVWQPKSDFSSKGRNNAAPSSKADPQIIDVEFEEK